MECGGRTPPHWRVCLGVRHTSDMMCKHFSVHWLDTHVSILGEVSCLLAGFAHEFVCVREREAPLTTTRALHHSHISEGQQYRHVHLVSRHGVVEVVCTGKVKYQAELCATSPTSTELTSLAYLKTISPATTLYLSAKCSDSDQWQKMATRRLYFTLMFIQDVLGDGVYFETGRIIPHKP